MTNINAKLDHKCKDSKGINRGTSVLVKTFNILPTLIRTETDWKTCLNRQDSGWGTGLKISAPYWVCLSIVCDKVREGTLKYFKGKKIQSVKKSKVRL